MRDAILFLAVVLMLNAAWRAYAARQARKQWEALVERLLELKH